MSELKYYKLFHRTSALTNPEFISIVEFGNGDEVYLKSETDKVIVHQKYKRCLAMAEWCESTALWCYQAANTLPIGFHATLYGKPVMIEPDRLFNRFVLLNNWGKRWRKLAEKFKEDV